jgi:indolepyruvate ferredoxin oxidoreductase alpha subunit
VVVARAVCPLYHRAVTGKKKPLVFQVQDSCDMCRECIDHLACPAFTEKDGKIAIDERLCNACSVCSQICDSIKPKKLAG